MIATCRNQVAPSFAGLSFSVDPPCSRGVLGERKVGHEVRDVDVVGVVAALREFAQAGDSGGEVVLGVENGVVEAQGQLQFRRGVGNAGDTDFGEQDGPARSDGVPPSGVAAISA